MKSKTNLSALDHLTDSLCECRICYELQQKPNPQIFIDQHYHTLKSSKYINNSHITANTKINNQQNPTNNNVQDFYWYLRKLAYTSKTLPHFPIIDTIILQKGQPLFYIFYQKSQLKLHLNSLLSHPQTKSKISQVLPYPLTLTKQKILDRKIANDIEYQKQRHKQKHPQFQWAQLDHEAQKLIKQFEKKIKFTDQILNRVAIIKQKQKPNNNNNNSNDTRYNITRSTEQKHRQSMLTMRDSIASSNNTTNNINNNKDHYQTQEKILSRYQFNNLFDKTRVKVCQLTEISYMQLFPIMYGEQQRSRSIQIKYFRHLQHQKQLFKQALNYVIAWVEKNQTLQKMEQQFINNYFYNQQNLRTLQQYPNTLIKRLTSTKQQQYLSYISYKLLLHLQLQSNIQVSQCLLQFITPDDGATYYLKQINYIKYQQKPHVQIKQNKLPTYKPIDKEDYIHDIQKSMRQIFQNLEDNYHRLNKDWEAYQNKTIHDRAESDRVFKTGRQLKLQAQTRSLKFQSQLFNSLNNATDSLDEFGTFTPLKFNQISNQSNLPSLHEILKSSNQSYKEQMLGLSSTRSKHNLSKQHSSVFNKKK